jgi:hypothetical protein
MNSKSNTSLGKKILYACVIGMSSLILLGSIVGIIGVWLVERPLSDAAVTTLSLVEKSTAIVRASNTRVDQALAGLQVKTTEISDASQQLSQNVADKGLVLVLLPEEKEQQLIDTASSVRDTYTGIRESIGKGLDLYRSINRMPLVSLPGLSDEQMAKIDASVSKTQSLAEALRSEIADFRTGVASTIEKVDAAATLLNNEITQVRDTLSELDSRLAALEVLMIRLQQVIPSVLLVIAVIISLVFAFIIFTQVELIRLYINRWRLLGQPQGSLPAETLAQPALEGEAGSETE